MLGYPGDYLYFDSGMPFVIPGVPGSVVMSTTAIIVLLLLYVVLDYKTVFRRNKKVEEAEKKVEEAEI